jgi:predicted metal-dependent hydrolase
LVGTSYLVLSDQNFPWQELQQQLVDLFTRKKALGWVFFEGMLDHLRPDFHPSQHPMHPEALAYLETLAS